MANFLGVVIDFAKEDSLITLLDRVVVITGASSGVGRATAQAFALSGARVALLARNEKALAAAKKEIEEAGGEAFYFVVDVSDFKALQNTAEKIEKEVGPIEVWVNNAMVSIMAPFDKITAEEFKRVTDVTYLGYVWGTQIALKLMKAKNSGVVVQVGSALAYRSIPLQSAYCGAKHAIVGFTESVRCELIHEKSKIEITMVELPAVNTPQFNFVRNKMGRKSKPVGTIFQPEVAGEAILWAALNPKKEYLLGMPTVESVLGNRIAPNLLDRYVTYKTYKEHLTEVPDSSRSDNLFSPVDVDYGVRGPYDEDSKEKSPQFVFSKYKSKIFSGLFIASFLGFLFKRRRLT